MTKRSTKEQRNIELERFLAELRRRSLYTQKHSLPPLVVNNVDASPMVLVPGGKFEMGDGLDEDCGKHSVYLDSYYIGMYMVTNRQYKVFIDATGHRAPSQGAWIDAVSVWQGDTFPEEFATHPVVCVNWDDAKTYAEWAGCMLPTEAQWEKAAKGLQGYLYPWGDDWDEDKCRNRSNRLQDLTSEVYGYPDGVSGYGTWNQSGNVYEWCADWYGERYPETGSRENPEGPGEGSLRHERGSCWRYSDSLSFRCSKRSFCVPGALNDFRGFRIVKRLS